MERWVLLAFPPMFTVKTRNKEWSTDLRTHCQDWWGKKHVKVVDEDSIAIKEINSIKKK